MNFMFHLSPGLNTSIVLSVLHIWQGYFTFSYYFIFDRIVCALDTLNFINEDIVKHIIRNLNIISVQSWTYLYCLSGKNNILVFCCNLKFS